MQDLSSCWLFVLPIACSIASVGIAVSIALNTSDDSITLRDKGELFEMHRFCARRSKKKVNLPDFDFGLNREVLPCYCH